MNARRHTPEPRPKWVVLIAKGFSQVAAEIPKLRQSYMTFPWPHIYEHEESIAAIAVEREYKGEESIFFPKFHAPTRTRSPHSTPTCRLLQGSADRANRRVLAGSFRQPAVATDPSVDVVVCPECFRRHSGALRDFRNQRLLGAGRGIAASHLPSTVLLNFGMIDSKGDVDLRLVYDHRVLNGATITHRQPIEEVLNDRVAMELTPLPAILPWPERSAA